MRGEARDTVHALTRDAVTAAPLPPKHSTRTTENSTPHLPPPCNPKHQKLHPGESGLDVVSSESGLDLIFGQSGFDTVFDHETLDP